MELWGSASDGHIGGILPSSLPEFVKDSWGTLQLHKIPPLGSHPLVETWAELNRQLSPNRREFVNFSMVSYSPFPYLPQAVAIASGRYIGVSPSGTDVFRPPRKCGNCCFYHLLVFESTPNFSGRCREAALVAALLPMAQFEYASLAPDAAAIATSFLFTAVALRATVRGSWSPADIIYSIISGIVFCSIKPVYAPLLATGLPAILPFGRKKTPQEIFRILVVNAAIVGGVVAVAAGWLASTSYSTVIFDPDPDTKHQIIFIATHPIRYARTIVVDLVHHGIFYVMDTIGILGAWTVYLAPYVYILSIIIFILASAFPVTESPKLPHFAFLWYLGIIVTVFILVDTAIYVLSASEEGRNTWIIFGVAGRYFLPLGALAAATFTLAISPAMRRSGAEMVYALVIVGSMC